MRLTRFPARPRGPLELFAALNRYALAAYRGERAIYPLVRELERNFSLSRDELEAAQDKALAAIVDHAFAHSPFYRRKFAAVGFKPG
ncbi:MAG TPA: hypothetical protein PLR32_07030, partial [candidate division Zixibacteria bacterium]|nr:hypothetical protein [candidate division Zixibacteria bacterium]